MKAEKLSFEGFRNLKDGECRLHPGVNIFFGQNAQGKTNFLEGVWLFTGSKSFRGAKDREMVAFGKDEAHLQLEFYAGERQQTASIDIRTRRTAQLNGIKQASPARMAGKFCGVVFSPAHLSLIKEGPEGRRRFMDGALCQLRPAYIKEFSAYHKTLQQRNALLKEGLGGAAIPGDVLDVWDERLAQTGAVVFAARSRYWEWLQPVVAEIYEGLSCAREKLTLRYDSCAGRPGDGIQDVYTRLLDQLRQRRGADQVAGFTTGGVHRDDLTVEIDGQSARTYGSQGQQRSAVLALKLAEAALLKKETGEQPVMLLDDVMSELDISRQDYILNHIHDRQVLITCCDPAPIRQMTDGAAFEVKGGQILQKDG